MISLNSSRQICMWESNFKLSKNFYSHRAFIDFSWLKIGSGSLRNWNACGRRYCHPRSGTSTARERIEDHSAKILKSWSRQLECIIAFRLRRTFQVINVYKKWWGDVFDNLTIKRFANEISKKRLHFTVCLAPVFDWRHHRIRSEELANLSSELEHARQIAVRDSTYPSNIPVSSEHVENVKSNCTCIRCQHLADDNWDLFYESNSLKIWRKEHLNYPEQGLFVYKVYGHFDDVSADDFFRVQIDTEYRKEWDPNAVELNVIDSDTETNSDVLYWEFLFPRMFHNRDYVYNRRYEINDEKQYIAIVNESVDHPACPEKPPIHRVREYWSHTIMKPTNGSFEKPGVEFTITYFDNPELMIPNYLSVWYTLTGMAEYLEKQRAAAHTLAVRRSYSEKMKEKSMRDEARLAVLKKDPEWAGSKDTGPPKRVMLY